MPVNAMTIEGRTWLTNGAMVDGVAGDGPADRGTYTFIQEVLRIPNTTAGFPRLKATETAML